METPRIVRCTTKQFVHVGAAKWKLMVQNFTTCSCSDWNAPMNHRKWIICRCQILICKKINLSVCKPMIIIRHTCVVIHRRWRLALTWQRPNCSAVVLQKQKLLIFLFCGFLMESLLICPSSQSASYFQHQSAAHQYSLQTELISLADRHMEHAHKHFIISSVQTWN